jgi:hypothetical protein
MSLKGGVMKEEPKIKRDECPICTFYISQWQIGCNKTITIGDKIFHKACLIDFKIRYGVDYAAQLD